MCVCIHTYIHMGFPGGSDSKESACNEGDWGSILRWQRSPGEGNGNALRYSCLENPVDRGAWWAIVHGVAKSWTRLSDQFPGGVGNKKSKTFLEKQGNELTPSSNVCVCAGGFLYHQAILRHQLGVLQFNSILILSILKTPLDLTS